VSVSWLFSSGLFLSCFLLLIDYLSIAEGTLVDLVEDEDEEESTAQLAPR
jgi:hypothetical protein